MFRLLVAGACFARDGQLQPISTWSTWTGAHVFVVACVAAISVSQRRPWGDKSLTGTCVPWGSVIQIDGNQQPGAMPASEIERMQMMMQQMQMQQMQQQQMQQQQEQQFQVCTASLCASSLSSCPDLLHTSPARRCLLQARMRSWPSWCAPPPRPLCPPRRSAVPLPVPHSKWGLNERKPCKP